MVGRMGQGHFLVPTQCRLSLMLANLPDHKCILLLDALFIPSGLYGGAVEAVRERFEAIWKDREALSNLLPCREANPPASAAQLKGETAEAADCSTRALRTYLGMPRQQSLTLLCGLPH